MGPWSKQTSVSLDVPLFHMLCRVSGETAPGALADGAGVATTRYSASRMFHRMLELTDQLCIWISPQPSPSPTPILIVLIPLATSNKLQPNSALNTSQHKGQIVGIRSTVAVLRNAIRTILATVVLRLASTGLYTVFRFASYLW